MTDNSSKVESTLSYNQPATHMASAIATRTLSIANLQSPFKDGDDPEAFCKAFVSAISILMVKDASAIMIGLEKAVDATTHQLFIQALVDPITGESKIKDELRDKPSQLAAEIIKIFKSLFKSRVKFGFVLKRLADPPTYDKSTTAISTYIQQRKREILDLITATTLSVAVKPEIIEGNLDKAPAIIEYLVDCMPKRIKDTLKARTALPTTIGALVTDIEELEKRWALSTTTDKADNASSSSKSPKKNKASETDKVTSKWESPKKKQRPEKRA